MPIKEDQYLWLFISCAFLFSNASAKEARIWTGMGPVPLRPYLMDGRPASKSRKIDEEPKFYAFAAYSKALDANTRRTWRRASGYAFWAFMRSPMEMSSTAWRFAALSSRRGGI